jgi:hypothetical protein
MGLKDAYQEKIEAQIKEWSAKLAEMKAKADKAGGDAKIHLYQQIDAMKARKEAAEEKLGELKQASAESWETLKEGMEKTLDEVKKTWEAMKAKFHH